MDQLGTIDIEGKRLALSARDLAKLSTPEGCQLQMVTDKVYKLDDSHNSDQEVDLDQDDGDEEQGENVDPRERERRRRKEYISLILNANRDPVKPGTKLKFKELQEEVEDGEFECDTGNLENRYLGIHRMHEQIGNYEDYLKTNAFEEISPQRVYKKTRVPGVSLPVTLNSLVIYNCAMWTENTKEPFDSTWLRRSTITSDMATDSLLPGIRELLLSSKKGELCEAFIRPEAAFGRLGAMPRIQPNATIFCLLEVVKVITQDKLTVIMRGIRAENLDLTFEDYFEASDEARRRGNYYYEQDQFKTALSRYKSGIRLLETLTYKNENEERRASDLLVKLYNNSARTANAAGIPRLALAACKQASELNNRVPKTHWHRMRAWELRGHLDRALGAAHRALQLFDDPQSRKLFQAAADNLKKRIQVERAESEELYKLMGRALVTPANTAIE